MIVDEKFIRSLVDPWLTNTENMLCLQMEAHGRMKYVSCMQGECNLLHVHNWIQFFVPMYNDIIFENYFIVEMQERREFILS